MDDERGGPSPGYALSSRGRWHFLYFLPLPHQQGAFRPSLCCPVVRERCRSAEERARAAERPVGGAGASMSQGICATKRRRSGGGVSPPMAAGPCAPPAPWSPRLPSSPYRSEEHTSELQSQSNLVCRLLLEKKKRREQASSTER